MLGRLGMTVGECLDAYVQVAQQAFTPVNGPIQGLFALPAQPAGTFSGDALKKAIQTIVQKYSDDAETLFADETCCKT
jgi:hypothetical protein